MVDVIAASICLALIRGDVRELSVTGLVIITTNLFSRTYTHRTV